MNTLIARLFIGALVIGGTLTPAYAQGQGTAKNGKKYVATRQIIFEQATGTLRLPTEAETLTLVDRVIDMTNRSTSGLTVTVRPDGTKAMNLAGRFAGVVLGRALADGTTEVRCVTTLDEALNFLGLEESTSQQ